MSSVSSAAIVAVIGLLAAVPAFAAQDVVANAGPVPVTAQPHSFVPAFEDALGGHGAVAAPLKAIDGLASASDATAMDFPVDGAHRAAEDKGQDVVATTAGVCEAYFAQSQSLTASLAAAFKGMAAGDKASLQVLLPTMQKQLDDILPYEMKAEVCDGNHINAYTSYQFFELNLARQYNAGGGFPANLPIVKQPDLNQQALAYAVGWTKYELGDFDGAAAAYGKGLAMFPHQHMLQQEYVAALFQLHQGAQALSFIDGVLGTTYDLTDEERAKMFEGRGVALLMMGALDPAIDSLGVAQKYHYTDEVAKLLDQLDQMKAAAAKK
ncbi:hypothetical protein [Asticcacaulis solisilvae]|uniref:hypothetical protein n=1 Tax=Asticcacaulis solisilvae TaxID=1217274 RepID=UPI003FD8D06B